MLSVWHRMYLGEDIEVGESSWGCLIPEWILLRSFSEKLPSGVLVEQLATIRCQRDVGFGLEEHIRQAAVRGEELQETEADILESRGPGLEAVCFQILRQPMLALTGEISRAAVNLPRYRDCHPTSEPCRTEV